MDIHLTEILEGQGLIETTSKIPNITQNERNISLVAGSFILWKSIKNIFSHPTLAVYGAAIGGVLIYRGVTGVCPIKNKLENDLPENLMSLEEI